MLNFRNETYCFQVNIVKFPDTASLTGVELRWALAPPSAKLTPVGEFWVSNTSETIIVHFNLSHPVGVLLTFRRGCLVPPLSFRRQQVQCPGITFQRIQSFVTVRLFSLLSPWMLVSLIRFYYIRPILLSNRSKKKLLINRYLAQAHATSTQRCLRWPPTQNSTPWILAYLMPLWCDVRCAL